MPVPGKKSTIALIEMAIESTATPSKAKGVTASSSKKKSGKKSVAFRPPKGQRKASTSYSSPDEEQPSAAPTRSPSKKKKSIVPPPPSGAASRTRSKSGFKVSSFSFLFIYCFYFVVLCCVFSFFCLWQGAHKPSRSGDAVVIVEITFIHSLFFFFRSDPYYLTFVVLILPLGF